MDIQKKIIVPPPTGAVAPLPGGCRCIVRYEARIDNELGRILDDGGQSQIAISLPPLPSSSLSSNLSSPLLSQSALLPGLVYGVHSMKVGETSSFVLPPEQAFGESGRPATAFTSEDDSLSARVGKALFRGGNGSGVVGVPVPSGSSLYFKISLLSCDIGPPLEEFDWDEMAKNNKEDGNKLLLSRDANGAIAAYEQALACLDKAKSSSLFNDSDDAAALISISRSEQRVILHSNKAQALLMLEKFLEAEASCTTALLLDLTHQKSLFRRARANRGLGKLSEARADARNLYSLNPSNLEARKLLIDLGLGDEINSKSGNAEDDGKATISNGTNQEPNQEKDSSSKESLLTTPDQDLPHSFTEAAASLRLRASGLKSSSSSNAFAKALKKGLTDGSLYEDKPDIDMDAVMKEARSVNADKNDELDSNKERRSNPCLWIYRQYNSCLAFLGCARKRKRS